MVEASHDALSPEAGKRTVAGTAQEHVLWVDLSGNVPDKAVVSDDDLQNHALLRLLVNY